LGAQPNGDSPPEVIRDRVMAMPVLVPEHWRSQGTVFSLRLSPRGGNNRRTRKSVII